jgi:RNA polymerase sigma-70 factor, ECF subfamily
VNCVADRGEPIGAAVLIRASTGDAKALAQIMAAHSGDMARVCMVVCGDPDVTIEAVQAAWVEAWPRLGSLRDSARLRPWLMTIAANKARQLLRSASRRRSYEGSITPAAAIDPGSRAELLDLAEAVSHLQPDDRRLLGLRFAVGLTSEEIARELGGSASAIRGRLARVVKRLRLELRDD